MKKNEKDLCELLATNGFCISRMISGSKSGYLDLYPKSYVVFNANIVTKEGKVWYGDIDITRDGKKLKEIAEEFGEPFYILREMDFPLLPRRFDTEKDKPKELIKRAVWDTSKDILTR